MLQIVNIDIIIHAGIDVIKKDSRIEAVGIMTCFATVNVNHRSKHIVIITIMILVNREKDSCPCESCFRLNANVPNVNKILVMIAVSCLVDENCDIPKKIPLGSRATSYSDHFPFCKIELIL